MVLLDFREKGKVRGTMIGGAIVGRVLGFLEWYKQGISI
jgi:hypothetical protein